MSVLSAACEAACGAIIVEVNHAASWLCKPTTSTVNAPRCTVSSRVLSSVDPAPQSPDCVEPSKTKYLC